MLEQMNMFGIIAHLNPWKGGVPFSADLHRKFKSGALKSLLKLGS